MLKLKSKDEVLKNYVTRYPALDKHFLSNLSSEYDRYAKVLAEMKTKGEVDSFFEKEVEENEMRYSDNAMVFESENSLHEQYMDIMAHYGIIMFFKENILED